MFSPDTLRLATISLGLVATDATVNVWNIGLRNSLTFGSFACSFHEPSINFSPSGVLLAAAGETGQVYIWRTDSGQRFGAPLHAGKRFVRFLAFYHDDTRLAIGMQDSTFLVIDINSGQLVSSHGYLKSLMRSPDWLACSPKGRFLACISRDTSIISHDTSTSSQSHMTLWDAAASRVVTTIHVNCKQVGERAVAFTADSRSIVIGEGGKIMVWKIEKICSLAAGPRCDPLAQLLREGLNQDGWVKGPSGELLLWIPPEYREYVQLPPCTLMFSKHRVRITGDADSLHYGDTWTSCWR